MKKTASITALIVAFSAAAGLAVLSTACGDDDTTNPGTTSSGGTSGSTSSSGATSSSSGATSSSSSGGTPASFQKAYEATCKNLEKCSPGLFGASFADVAACAKYYSDNAATKLPGQPDADQAKVDACAAKLDAAACGDPSPAECTFAGTNAKDAPCNNGSQCSSSVCTKAAPTDDCGKCGDAVTPPTPKKKGDACTSADTCEAGTACVGKTGETKCDTPKQLGEACTADGGECRPGLVCTELKCAEAVKYAKDGEKCGLDGAAFILCGVLTSTCVGTAPDAKCEPNAKAGEACSQVGAQNPTEPACATGLECGDDNKCAAVAECK